MANSVYFNGQIVPAEQACVSVFDSAVLHGASAFTTMLARGGKVFRLPAHLARLMQTVERLGLRNDADEATLERACGEVLAANELTDARMRITLSPGSIHGSGSTTVVTAEPLPRYPADWYDSGLTVMIAPFRQNVEDPTCGYKTGCYLPRMLARQHAAAAGADEALWYTPASHLAEACFCNVFLVRDGKLCTPPLNTPVLPGIVRAAVLELAGQLDIAFDDQTPLTVKEMLAASEIFLTSSTSGIRPVARIERHPVADEKPGPLTRRLMDAYESLLTGECGPARETS
ncbi:MAG: aminotransferase class IV [Planctomycetaceae bacterium]|nr:aminotransferase class IV [Planctomycetaceae bacterium]